jgi:hypothetical protein
VYGIYNREKDKKYIVQYLSSSLGKSGKEGEWEVGTCFGLLLYIEIQLIGKKKIINKKYKNNSHSPTFPLSNKINKYI